MKKDIQKKTEALRSENKTDAQIHLSKNDKLNNEGHRDVERMLKLMIASHRPG